MKRSVKLILLGIVIAGVCGIGVYSLTAPATVSLTEVTAKTAELNFTEQGLMVAGNVVEIYPLTQGKLISVNVEEGQNIHSGDVICVIDPEPPRIQIERIRSGIGGNQAQIANLDIERQKTRDELITSRNSLSGELRSLEAQERGGNISVGEQLRLQNILIEQSQKDLDRAEDELSKIETIYNAGSVSRTDYENALAAASKTRSALEANRQELTVIAEGAGVSSEEYYSGMKDSLNARIAGINQSLGKDYTAAMADYYRALIQADEASITQLEKDIENCTVISTVDGVVTRLDAISTNFASEGAPVAEITVIDGNEVEVYVSTNDVDSIKTGDTVGLTLKRREGDAEFTGRITHIGSHAEIKFTSLGVEERKIKVKILPEMEELKGASFGVGYSVDVKFIVYIEENKLTVPKTALFKDGGKDMLWVVRDGRAEAVDVVKGRELRTETVIESGLADGDYVVTDANNKDLRNGVSVKGE